MTLFQRLHHRRAEAALFLVMSTLYFFTVFHRIAVPGTIFNELQTGFHADAKEITRLGAIALYIYAFMQIPVGLIADRWGGARPLVIGGTMMCLGCLCIPMAPSLAWLYLAAALVSLGSSFMYLCLLKEVEELFDPLSFAPLLGLVLLLGYAGGLAGTSPLTFAIKNWGWRPAMLGAGLLCAAGLLGTVILLRGARRTHKEGKTISFAVLGQFVRTPGAYVMMIGGPANFAVYMVMQAIIGKKFMQDHCRLSPARAADVTFAMLIIVVLGSFIAGFLPRMIGQRRKPILVAAAVAAACGAAMLYSGIIWDMPTDWFVVGCLLLAMSCSTGAVGTTLFKEICPPGATALAAGLINSMCYAVFAAATQGAGLVLKAFEDRAVVTPEAIIYPAESYRAIFMAMLAVTCVSLVGSLFTPETRGQSRGSVNC
ncbi:MAG: MFS transporter [Planctomycetota bacterium]|nr:MFS transporter [Planctomycetota bacterium]